MSIGVETKTSGELFAHKRVVVDFTESLSGNQRPDTGKEFPFRIRHGNIRCNARSLRRDGGIANHAADFLDQVLLDRYVFSCAPAWNGDSQGSRARLLYAKLE